MLVFAFLGLGMALPYLALSFSPTLMRYMPKPGAWMETFKELMAFPMYAAALWLLWVLGVQVGINGMVAVASGALLLALALWLLQKGRHAARGWHRASVVMSLVLVVAALSTLRTPLLEPRSGGVAMGASEYLTEFEPFASGRVDELRSEGKPVLVNMTAAWCITCLANEQTTLSRSEERRVGKECRSRCAPYQ